MKVNSLANAGMPVDREAAPENCLSSKVSTFALLVALLLVLPACGQSDANPFGTVPAKSHDSGQGLNTRPEPGFLVYPVPMPAMCDFGPRVSTGGASEARTALIDKNGPQLPSVFSMSGFSVMGFVKGSWPVVFDYMLEQDSLLIVVIAPEGMEPLIYHLDGKQGHWQSRLTIPAQVGGTSLVAHYTIRALDKNIGQIGPSHLHVHGIAAGPKAVGSIGIDQVTFAPAAIHTAQGEKAHYTFHSISDFKRVDIDFIRLAMTRDHQIIAARVDGRSMGS